MIEIRQKRDPWMTDEGYDSLHWKTIHGNVQLGGAIIRLRFYNFRIDAKVFKYNTKNFRNLFQKERVWERLSG